MISATRRYLQKELIDLWQKLCFAILSIFTISPIVAFLIVLDAPVLLIVIVGCLATALVWPIIFSRRIGATTEPTRLLPSSAYVLRSLFLDPEIFLAPPVFPRVFRYVVAGLPWLILLLLHPPRLILEDKGYPDIEDENYSNSHSSLRLDRSLRLHSLRIEDENYRMEDENLRMVEAKSLLVRLYYNALSSQTNDERLSHHESHRELINRSERNFLRAVVARHELDMETSNLNGDTSAVDACSTLALIDVAQNIYNGLHARYATMHELESAGLLAAHQQRLNDSGYSLFVMCDRETDLKIVSAVDSMARAQARTLVAFDHVVGTPRNGRGSPATAAIRELRLAHERLQSLVSTGAPATAADACHEYVAVVMSLSPYAACATTPSEHFGTVEWHWATWQEASAARRKTSAAAILTPRR